MENENQKMDHYDRCVSSYLMDNKWIKEVYCNLIIIKPDAVKRCLVGKMISYFENKDYKIVYLKHKHGCFHKMEWREHYIEHRDLIKLFSCYYF